MLEAEYPNNWQSSPQQVHKMVNNANQFPMRHSFNGGGNNGYSITTNVVQGSNQNFRRFGQRKPVMTYVYGGMKGHTIERCYKKHRYPPGFKFPNKNQSVSGTVNQSMLTVGNESGFVNTNAVAGNDVVTRSNFEGSVQAPLITHDQYNHLMSLL